MVRQIKRSNIEPRRILPLGNLRRDQFFNPIPGILGVYILRFSKSLQLHMPGNDNRLKIGWLIRIGNNIEVNVLKFFIIQEIPFPIQRKRRDDCSRFIDQIVIRMSSDTIYGENLRIFQPSKVILIYSIHTFDHPLLFDRTKHALNKLLLEGKENNDGR